MPLEKEFILTSGFPAENPKNGVNMLKLNSPEYLIKKMLLAAIYQKLQSRQIML